MHGIRGPRGRTGPGTGCCTVSTGLRTPRILWFGQGWHPPGLWKRVWRRKAKALLLVMRHHRISTSEQSCRVGAMTEHTKDNQGVSLGLPSSSQTPRTHGTKSQVTSIPLRTALRIAREQQRSKSSRRKIFREEPERYLDIVHLMKDPGSE